MDLTTGFVIVISEITLGFVATFWIAREIVSAIVKVAEIAERIDQRVDTLAKYVASGPRR